MRSKRITKFGKKNCSLMIVLKMSFIVYLLLFMAGYVMSSTTAYFSSESHVGQQITTGEWVTSSNSNELAFEKIDKFTDESCSVIATLTNNGEAGLEDSTYSVYYAEEGQPETDGEQIDQGIIDNLKPGNSVELTYDADKSGFYQFSAEQPDDHPNEQTIWSDRITVECETKSDDDEDEVEKEEHEQDEDGAENEENDEEGDEEKETSGDTNEHQGKAEQDTEGDGTEKADDDSDDDEEKEETTDNQEQTDQSDSDEENSLEDRTMKNHKLTQIKNNQVNLNQRIPNMKI